MFGKIVLFSCRVVSTCSACYHSNSTKNLLELLAKMPKPETTRIPEAQRQRQVIAKRSEKYIPSTVYLQVIGSGAEGVPNTLYLFTDHKRYLFNCGESTQRLAYEHKVKLSRLEHIFITSKTWRNIGGLPGLSLTLQDVGVPHITLHGPEGLDELYNATRRFVIMKDMEVTMAKCSPKNDFEDNTLSVKYVLLSPQNLLLNNEEIPPAKKPKMDMNVEKDFEEFIHDETDYYRSEAGCNAENKITKDNTTGRPGFVINDPVKKKAEKVLSNLQKQCIVAYICRLSKRPGTLDLAKCVEFGVKPGPMLGQLKNGQDVVLPNGNLVLSKDVKTPDDPGPVFIVLEVPELSYLKQHEFSNHFANGSNAPEEIPSVIVHFTPPHVFNHPTYRNFMSKFGPTTHHLVLNSQNSCLGSESVHRTQHKLHLLDPDIFPLLKDASVPAVWHSQPTPHKTDSPEKARGLEELKIKVALAQFKNIVSMEGSCMGDDDPNATGLVGQDKLEVATGRTLSIFHLRPNKQLDRSAEPKLHIQDYIQETMGVDGFVTSLEHFRRQAEQLRYSRASTKEYPKVVFLGTGSCIPSKTRNTSAILLFVDENRSMLLDCGEGTYGQLVRFYGPKKVKAVLSSLKAIYVSHLHADHHIGLIGVLQARRQALSESNPEAPIDPVYLLAPGQIYTWLSVYDKQFENIMNDFMLIPNQTLLDENDSMTSAMLANIGVQQIRVCHVSHCPNAFGIAVTVDESNKITYSGDTIPCDELVKLGEKSTLLIHEATMEDELEEEARTKMHSTTSQAIEAGRRMAAQYTVLTHFSQRYARLPRLSPRILNDNCCVGIAFDNMQVSMSDLSLLPHMYAPLQLMYAEHCMEMEAKATHRARRKELRSAAAAKAIGAVSEPIEEQRKPARKVSPGGVSTISTPAPRIFYKESNASRLRQELKGMAVYGTVKDTSRSKSTPPIKSRPLPNTQRSSFGAPTLKSSHGHLPTPESTASSTNKSCTGVKKNNTTKTEDLQKGKRIASRQPRSEVSFGSTKSAPPHKEPVKVGNDYAKPLMTALNTKVIVRKDFKTHSNIPPNRLPYWNITSAAHNVVCGVTRPQSSSGSRPRFAERRECKVVDPLRDVLTDRLKVHERKDHSSVVIGRPISAVNNKSFKPQLADIKSSYLLLNENQRMPKNSHKLFDEESRRKQLLDVKKKYLSKQFKNDRRYQNIEGLNWISW
ncbi:hypothetical protein ACJJTC_003939 [Scirpophaga incertulas]